ncbi:MAG: hypothetical protein RR595_03270 [Lysinibacillus sp.]
MYYNPYLYFVSPSHYPMLLANHPSPSPLPRQLAMPTDIPFPSVNTQKLKTSAQRIPAILSQIRLLTDKIASSEQFAHSLMNFAQLSNKAEVDQLITSTGITVKYETKFTPDGIQIRFIESGCCGLTMNLSW